MTAVLLVPLLIVSGAGIDFMRHEVLRSKLQDSLDRGVLAAASLSQTKDTETTIRSYLKSARLPDDIELHIEESSALNSRRVSASASLTVPVSFLGLAGVGDLSAGALSVAEEKRSNVELSLILDVSGSMVDKGVFQTMKTAASDFVGTVLRPDVVKFTTLNIVPFAGDVGLGPTIFDYLARMAKPTRMANHPGTPLEDRYKYKHTKSFCFRFAEADFSKTFPFFPDIEQTAVFSRYNYSAPATKEKWWCPSEPDTSITVMGNDAAALRKKVGAMKSYDGTGTHIAMKWALMLLDPVIQPYVAYATTQTSDVRISPSFKNRPAKFDDRGTRKFIVLMTDGETSFQEVPKNTQPGVYETQASLSAAAPTGGGGLTQTVSSSTAETRMMDLCTDAKRKGVTVFTIGFKITGGNANHFYKQLEKCASSASHFYRVEDTNIAAAFRSIAGAIDPVRLVNRETTK